MVDFPTFGKPTMPQFKAMQYLELLLSLQETSIDICIIDKSREQFKSAKRLNSASDCRLSTQNAFIKVFTKGSSF